MSGSRTIALAAVLAAAVALPAEADAATKKKTSKKKISPDVTTTSYGVVGSDATGDGYKHLKLLGGWKRVVRDDLGAAPGKGRHRKRRSMLYFGQLSDFQLADEESPARVEVTDPLGPPFTSAWRPQEALGPFTVDQAIRQMNRFDRSPVRNNTRKRARMALTITTGDSADNQQRNEVEWVVKLLEGGTVNPNSGIDGGGCAALYPPGEGARYTGVQDYDDVVDSDRFFDPDRPMGQWVGWPSYPGLMDRAQMPFEAQGLKRPSYVAFGNHDGTVQGNLHALQAIDDLVRGCIKPLSAGGTVQSSLLSTSPLRTVFVPPDPARGFVDRPTYKQMHTTGQQSDAHGFKNVDGAEQRASRGQAAYYSFSPKPGVRLIAINTVAEGDRINSEGNLDDPQFRWIAKELDEAAKRKELVMLFGHHPIRSLKNSAVDEQAGPCELKAVNGPGCDLDPRRSSPIHLGADLQKLLLDHPNVIAYIAGHTHEHKVTPFKRANGKGGFWGIETASEIDWPIQSRLLEVMDNKDGTISIFGTILDHGGSIDTPTPGTPAASFGPETLAAIAREFSFNDPQVGGKAGAIGKPGDRNVELLLPDPR